MDSLDSVKWMHYAKNDLDVAKHLFDSFFPKQYEIICYHCQQSAEKAAKAVCVFFKATDRTVDIPKTHDISSILKSIEKKQKSTSLFSALQIYSRSMQYQHDTHQICGNMTKRDTQNAIIHAEKIYSWAETVCRSNF